MQPLPIDEHLDAIQAAVDRHGAAIVVAPPGAGKTTRVAPHLSRMGRVILLQPRRVAARALARRIADERGWRLGGEVGWQVRFERRFNATTRILVATEGILTARLQGDPLLSDFDVMILDEFHERSLHADLALALTKQARAARPELKVVVMSATLEAGPVAEYLGGCPVIQAPGRIYPVEVRYTAGQTPAAAVRDVLREPGGHVLCFLPGAGEIRRLAQELATVPAGVSVLPLHGSLDGDAQDAALAPSQRRKVILATNIAETSLTVEGVSVVIDSGYHKVLRYDHDRGIDRLDVERIGLDSAEQRAGRAGRTGPGIVVRLWDPRERLRAHREPEIERVDLAAPFLDVIAWGGDPLSFDWFEPPPSERAAHAIELLERLGAVKQGRLTALGEGMRRFPLHPRLACVLAAASGSPRAAMACALLSERWSVRSTRAATSSDVLSAIDSWDEMPGSVKHAARELRSLAERVLGPCEGEDGEADFLRALLAGYPDRVARRRESGSPRLLLASGHGAVLARESGVRDGEWLIAVDVESGPRGPRSEALVRLASRIEPDWLAPDRTSREHVFDEDSDSVRAFEREWYGELILRERPVPPDPDQAGALLVAALERRGLGADSQRVLRRASFACVAIDLGAVLRCAVEGATKLPQVDLLALLPGSQRRELERLAPDAITVPSGRRHTLDYREDGSVSLAVKLQELFGLAESPRIGPRSAPVVLELLAPNGRPVQTTRDLRGFWERTYAQVRKELRGRYPKHPWPEDPWKAQPTARAKPRAPKRS